jgi:hypothetical protein
MPQLAVDRPLDKCDLHDNFRMHPVHAESWQSFGFRKGRCGLLDGVETPPEIE